MALQAGAVAVEGIGYGARAVAVRGWVSTTVGAVQDISPGGLDASATFGATAVTGDGTILAGGLDASATFGSPIVWIPTPGGLTVRTREPADTATTAETSTARSQTGPVEAATVEVQPSIRSQERATAATAGAPDEVQTREQVEEVVARARASARSRSRYIPPPT